MIYTTSIKDITKEQLNGFFVGWPNPPSSEVHLKLLKRSSHVVVAIDEGSGQVIGFITANSDGILSAYIPFLEVLPAYQGQGIGQQLVQEMFALLKDIYMIDLMCDEDLLGYYEKLGMQRAHGMIRRNYSKQSGV
ncbi:GNAT family N-acetyltransferase [Paenisporosarcina quisquiliarum]|uniref:GNAT family N-acetyltransferase n=1 Tax=Paenisporosarcina quisquiliarum TaxID=365346 RepID=A0A9X3RDJ4_9BACL|nr:GNAT family N-acetyltransferase [Paenisporosarcina quisquiliarum]MCZ8537601.1 GNAT family N-acetyltransferase [Paenisporosarcina quisquiliarum]